MLWGWDKVMNEENQAIKLQQVRADMEKVFTGLADLATQEIRKSKPYQEMSFTGSAEMILRRLHDQVSDLVVTALQVFEDEGYVINDSFFDFLFASPYLIYELDKYIQRNQGGNCTTYKAVWLFNEHWKIMAKREEERDINWEKNNHGHV